eukprot:CAMPEP_0178421036 /NCGR_PEP_ID=MMETSP0689_2-20121128/26443_1 /TAXON_ID=160604 /ORGANISM="Amphidinium massartii, Strain CS-259" /LENGTH=53 /DNA_ID=CAMNT_0020042541 /DNA_START=98 /DNA_END=256 /DNA_ORIENTATION=+
MPMYSSGVPSRVLHRASDLRKSFSMHRAREAYLSALVVSSALLDDGDTLTNIR